MDALELIMTETLENVKEQSKKIDGVKDDINELKRNLIQTETGIMERAEKRFVSKVEFPQLWKSQQECHEKRSYERLERNTNVVTMLIKWGGWIIAAAGVITALLAQAGVI